ncbi:MAG: hypothetical protein K1566_18990 [Candidatus Thiodiazotropha sp. (ex. Lucinisca nassula)]|nr:hypothetical protein [Candidatus Thiodiazotropha sp. (ex. Lucinisca nassula)]
MIRIIQVILPALFSLQACQTNPSIDSLTSDQRVKIINMEVFDTSTSEPHKIISQVKGISCHKNKHVANMVSKEEAIEGIKFQAAHHNADAVINLLCQTNSGTDWKNNCWSSIVCVGDAIEYTH